MLRRAMLVSVMAFGAVVTPIAEDLSVQAASPAPHPLGMPDSRTLNLPVLAAGQLQDDGGGPGERDGRRLRLADQHPDERG